LSASLQQQNAAAAAAQQDEHGKHVNHSTRHTVRVLTTVVLLQKYQGSRCRTFEAHLSHFSCQPRSAYQQRL
jgi:hypothetical protein